MILEGIGGMMMIRIEMQCMDVSKEINKDT